MKNSRQKLLLFLILCFILCGSQVVKIKTVNNDYTENKDFNPGPNYEQYHTNDTAVYGNYNERGYEMENTKTKDYSERLYRIDLVRKYLSEFEFIEKGRIGISFYCLTTQKGVGINEDEYFFSASTIKMPTHMMLAERISVGDLSWEKELTVYHTDWLEGSGVLKDQLNIGDKITVYNALYHSIKYSDNLAHRMITRTVIPGFTHEQFGLDNSNWDLTRTIFNRYLGGPVVTGRMQVTPNQLTELFKILYREKDNYEGYQTIINMMKESFWTDRFKTNLTSGIVAHTPGWTTPYEHDSGIFFTEQPYILVVYTYDIPDAIELISYISDQVFRILTR